MTTGMRRRARKQPAEVRRETVLEAAVRVFARTSYHAAGTAEIAREAGISEPAIYRYFDSKRALYLAALERSGAVVLEQFRAIAVRTPLAHEALGAMGDWYRQMVVADPLYLRLRHRAIAETDDEEIRAALRNFYLEIHGFVADIYRRGQEQGVFRREADPAGYAWFFLAVGQVLDLQRLIGMAPVEVMETCDSVVAIATRALST